MISYLLSKAIKLCRDEKKHEARPLLQRVLQANPRDVIAWFWYADTFVAIAERQNILWWCLRFNPQSATTISGLKLLGAGPEYLNAAISKSHETQLELRRAKRQQIWERQNRWFLLERLYSFSYQIIDSSEEDEWDSHLADFW